MEKPTVENKVKEIAEAMGLTYLCDSGVKEIAARLRTPTASRCPPASTCNPWRVF